MYDIIIQLIVLAIALLIAGVRSLRFAPSDLTTFELERQAKRGVDQALAEQRLRLERPQLLALQRFISLLLTIVMVVILASTYAIWLGIFLAFLWSLVIEFLETRLELRNYAEKYAVRYLDYIYKAVHFLRVPLSFIADKQLLRSERQATFYSKEELLKAIEGDKTLLSKDEKTFIRQSLAYEGITIKDIMTPRSVVIAVEEDDTVGPVLLDRLHKSGQSRFPVIKKDLDHIVGMLFMHDLVPLKPRVKHVRDVMKQKVIYVHEDKTLDHALHAFLRTRRHLFVVVNEFEETTGVVSIEDVIETIIGRKIVDEFDQYEDLRAVAKLSAAKRQKTNSGEYV